MAHDTIFACDSYSTEYLSSSAMCKAISTLFRLAIEICAEVARFSFRKAPNRQVNNWALVISVIISANFFVATENYRWVFQIVFVLGIAQRRIITVHRCSDGSQAIPYRAESKHPSGAPKPDFPGNRFLGTLTLSKSNSRWLRPVRTIYYGFRCGEAFHTALDKQTMDTAIFIFSPHHSYLCKWGVAYPHLGTIQ